MSEHGPVNIDDDWRAASEMVGHGLPGGIDQPGYYYWADGCVAALHPDGTIDVTVSEDHDPRALPVRHEPT
jgi:hypothetical protein